MNDKSNGLLVFVGLILAAVCFGVGRSTASTPDRITISHHILFSAIHPNAETVDEPGLLIKLIQIAPQGSAHRMR